MVRELIRLLVASLAFALYVTCPRMTAMIASQAKVARIDPVAVIVLGCLLGDAVLRGPTLHVEVR